MCIRDSAGTAALVAALVVFSSRARDAESDVGKLTKAEEENNKKIKEMNESYEELNENRKNAGEKIKVEYDDYEKLQVELDKIVDKNGKIKKGYEDRAKVITGELSEGLGVEIDIINGNTIPAYQKLRKEIKKTIALKEAEAMLNASKDSYVEARKNMKEIGRAHV